MTGELLASKSTAFAYLFTISATAADDNVQTPPDRAIDGTDQWSLSDGALFDPLLQ